MEKRRGQHTYRGRSAHRRGGYRGRNRGGRTRGGRGALPHISDIPEDQDRVMEYSSDEEAVTRDWAQVAASQPQTKYNDFGLPIGYVSHSPAKTTNESV